VWFYELRMSGAGTKVIASSGEPLSLGTIAP
jgi:hypothetical protein